MENFTMYQPMAKGKKNAIKRDDLTQRCIGAGLIGVDAVDKDRAMRKLLEKARLDYSITNDGDGSGYYRPSKEDYENLRKNNNRENKKAISTLGGLKTNKAIAEDYRVGRL